MNQMYVASIYRGNKGQCELRYNGTSDNELPQQRKHLSYSYVPTDFTLYTVPLNKETSK